MSNQKKTHELIRQNEQIVKKPQKHDANLQKNSILYFQIGLIVCLLAVFGLLEMKFERTIPKAYTIVVPDDPMTISVEKFKVYEEPKTEVKPKPQKKKVLLIKDPKIVDDDVMKEVLGIDTPEQNTSPETPIDPSLMDDFGGEPVIDDVPFFAIEVAPIYPGCEKTKTNEERKKCMSEKITKLVQRKFRGNDIASDYGLSGKQKIYVRFKIDKTGHVTDIQTRSPHPKLEDEAERIINFIPKMTPGKQRDKNVGVIYTLPIIFYAE
ncbi:energy transducer TonB [Flavivirga sp. 57AJ16]|uniref:energy transducer TonB n=1 Tax=Flavivirga sp. 57AJ16 TaxID=3025307 RepID=UPI0023669CD5|nr:energy transducer TonB [Flavivirga sp. 57AJ16]MDD7885575.1 energy transducer TonB [Flavivirga sp. 57AJ16]